VAWKPEPQDAHFLLGRLRRLEVRWNLEVRAIVDMPLYPLTFEPILKERIWGGRRLEDRYSKALPAHVPVGESWEISDRPGDVSVIRNGPLAGKDLQWVIHNFGSELMGGAKLYRARFPLLVKILDAQHKLSLQVHPPPAKAAELGSEPKTEMWYVAEATPDAELYVGLKRGCTRQEFKERIRNGSVADCFHRIRVQAGDVMFLPSGRVHALGAGVVIFEIQQNSDTTYRVFDWNRVGLDGKPRALHIEESLQSIDFEDFEPDLARPQAQPGPVQLASLVSDPLFTVELAQLRGGETLPLGPGKMQILGIVSGHSRVLSGSEELALARGQFCLIPASLRGVVLEAQDSVSCLCVRAGEGFLP
jgi:mannose-6-phosphate isomerase